MYLSDCGTCYLWLSCVEKLKIHSHGKWAADRQCTAKSTHLARHQGSIQPDCMGLTSFEEHMGSPFGLKCFFDLLSEGIIGLRTGWYGKAYYNLKRHADFVISRLNLLTTLYSGIFYLYRFGGQFLLLPLSYHIRL